MRMSGGGQSAAVSLLASVSTIGDLNAPADASAWCLLRSILVLPPTAFFCQAVQGETFMFLHSLS